MWEVLIFDRNFAEIELEIDGESAVTIEYDYTK